MSRISRKELKRDEFVEATKEAEHWLEDNWQLVAKIAAGIGLVGVLVAIGFWVVKSNREKAAALFAEGLGQYQQAQAAGFDDPAQIEAALITFDASAKKGGGPVGQVANYYRGVSLHRLGRNEDAIVALLEVSGSAFTVLQIWKPSRPGMRRSSSTMSGRNVATSRPASKPSAAVSTS